MVICATFRNWWLRRSIAADPSTGHHNCKRRQRIRISCTWAYSHRTAFVPLVMDPREELSRLELSYFDAAKLAVAASLTRFPVCLQFAARTILRRQAGCHDCVSMWLGEVGGGWSLCLPRWHVGLTKSDWSSSHSIVGPGG